MNKSLREIITTSSIVVENMTNFDEPFLEVPRIRVLRSLCCTYCGTLWEAVVYEGVENRICCNCVYDLKEFVFEHREKFEIYSKTMENKKKVLQDVIEVGFNPDRTWQTQLADTLLLFKRPN